MNERGMDAAIDKAVREIMTVEARTDITRQVLSRLEPSAPRIPWLMVAGGTSFAAAAIVLAMVLLPRSRAVSPVPPAPATAVSTPAIHSVPTPAEPAETGPGVPAAPVSRGPAYVAAATLADDEWPYVEIAPLRPLDPIALAPIVQESIVPDAVVVEPLIPLAELRVEPLTIADERSKGDL